MKNYISDISFLNSNSMTEEDFFKLYREGLFEDAIKWDEYTLSKDIKKVIDSIESKLKHRMSQLSLGIFKVMESGPGKKPDDKEEICMFTGFGEIETTNEIVKNITIDGYSHISPTLFHNSVHHTALGYYTIIKSRHNPCITISDGLRTNLSFINYISKRVYIDKSIIIAYGDEYSPFLVLDRNLTLEIVPSFCAYRLTPGTQKGFGCADSANSLEELFELDAFKNAETIICDRDTFLGLKKTDFNKRIMTEYPIIKDNPCGVIFRLAFPFYFDIKGNSIVIDKSDERYFYFEVEL